jgi:site-specific DNA-methyltransferase (adenine-specific)
MKDLKNKIIQGDCLEKLKELEDKSIDMVLTDIPYGEVNRTSNGLRNLDKGVADVFDFSLEEMVNEFCRVTKGSMYVFCGTEQVSEIRKQMVLNGLSTRLIIWNKTNPSPMNGQHIWLSSIECCVYGKFKNATFNEHCKGSVLNFPSGRGKVHPTEKPLKLFEYIISVSSNKNDIILDPFMGSGTTGVACKNLNRDFIGIEKEPDYCKIAEARIRNTPTRLF